MFFNFPFSFSQLNFFLLSEKIKKEVIEKIKLIVIEAIKLIKYRKLSRSYQNRFKLYKQVVNKVLFIAKTLYLSYSNFFLTI